MGSFVPVTKLYDFPTRTFGERSSWAISRPPSNTETIKKRHSIKKVIWNVEIQHGPANSGLSTNLDINLGNNISESK